MTGLFVPINYGSRLILQTKHIRLANMYRWNNNNVIGYFNVLRLLTLHIRGRLLLQSKHVELQTRIVEITTIRVAIFIFYVCSLDKLEIDKFCRLNI